MKKLMLTLTLQLLSLLAFSQSDTAMIYTDANYKITTDVREAVNSYRVYKKDSSSWVFETFDINKKIIKKETYADLALTIKRGQHVEYKKGKPVYKGMYIDGLKEGTFIQYDTLGNVIQTDTYALDSLNGKSVAYWQNGNKRREGEYLKGKYVGTWISYYKNGNVAIKETYREGEIDLSKFKRLEGKALAEAYDRERFTSTLFFDMNGQPTTRNKVESRPDYPGGIESFYQFLAQNIKYPPGAAEKNIQGEVRLAFTINEKGEIEDLLVESCPHPSLGAEAIRVMKLGKKWIPAKFGGENVSVGYHVPIRFSLNQ